jgi:SAM-dependent methyltransferase
MAYRILKKIVPLRLRASIRNMAETPIGRTLVPAGILRSLLPYGPDTADALTWDKQYGSGRWDYLASLQEMPRNALIVGYCGSLHRRISVLDLGCGPGLLPRLLLPLGYSAYVGVDLSDAAITRARANAPENTEFVAADVEGYTPDRRFDVVVLNEVLYYLKRPEVLMQRSTSFLENQGVLIVSLWDNGQGWRVWRQCANRVSVLDEVWVRNENAAWWVRLCRPLDRS